MSERPALGNDPPDVTYTVVLVSASDERLALNALAAFPHDPRDGCFANDARTLPSIVGRHMPRNAALLVRARLEQLGCKTELWSEHPADPYQAHYVPAENAAGALRHLTIPQRNTFVLLIDTGFNKINVIKEIRALTGSGLKEAKDIVEAAPSVVGHFTSEAASAALGALAEAGAQVMAIPEDDATTHLDVFLLGYTPDADRSAIRACVDTLGAGVARRVLRSNARLPSILVRALASYLALGLKRKLESFGAIVELVPANPDGGPCDL